MELLNKEETELEDLENSQPIHTEKKKKKHQRERKLVLKRILGSCSTIICEGKQYGYEGQIQSAAMQQVPEEK